MIVKLTIKNCVLIKKLYDALLLSLLRAVKLSFFLLFFSVSLNISSKSKIGIEFFSAAFSKGAATDKEQAAKAVWKIQIGNIFNGSGFFISKNKIVTNFHVIQPAESIGLENVTLVQEGNPEQLKVKRIVSLSILEDLAVLEIEGAVSHFLSLPSEDVLNSSKSLYILGYPEGKFKEIRQTGVLKDDSFFGNHSNNEGASGSPVLNESHQLVGVSNEANENLINFISIKTLRSFIEAEYFSCKSLNVKACFNSSREIFIKSMQEVKEAGDYFKIAGVFYRGDGVKQDFFEGIKWLEKAVDKGHALAQKNLAKGLIEGDKIFFKGIELMRKSADQGNALAQYWLAIIYYEGKGVKQDFFEAIKWMRKSADQGYVLAQYWLAIVYILGERVEQDFFEARKLLEKSAAQGSDLAQYELGLIYYYGKGVKKDLSKAREWLEKSAVQGHAKAKRMLYIMKMEQGFQTLKTKCLDIFRN